MAPVPPLGYVTGPRSDDDSRGSRLCARIRTCLGVGERSEVVSTTPADFLFIYLFCVVIAVRGRRLVPPDLVHSLKKVLLSTASTENDILQPISV